MNKKPGAVVIYLTEEQSESLAPLFRHAEQTRKDNGEAWVIIFGQATDEEDTAIRIGSGAARAAFAVLDHQTAMEVMDVFKRGKERVNQETQTALYGAEDQSEL